MRLFFTIDGSQVEIDLPVRATLAEAVQNLGGNLSVPTPCRMATCGACTILLNDAPVLSCITQVSLCEETHLTTAAGLAHDSRLVALRNLFADPLNQACGACAFGLMASAAALLDANPRPTREDARHALAGHACLCIGYGPILDAVTARGTSPQFAPPAVQQPDPLPSREEIAETLAQERGVVDEEIDPYGPIRVMLQTHAAAKDLDHAANAFGWSWRQSAAKETERQLSGSWVALQGTADDAAVVFVSLEVDSETEMVSLRRVTTLLIGATGNFDSIAESGVMRGIFLALRPSADAGKQLFPPGFPTSIDVPEIISLISVAGVSMRKPSGEVRRNVCLATVRAIAGAIHNATRVFPECAPYAPQWSKQIDLDNASNIS